MSLYAHIFDDMPARPEFPVEIPDPILIQEWIRETPHLTELVEENSAVCCPWIIEATAGFVIGMGGYLVFNRFRNKIMNWFQDFIGGIRRGYNSSI